MTQGAPDPGASEPGAGSGDSRPDAPRPDADGQGQDPQHPPSPGEFYRAAWTFYLVLAVLGILWLGYSAGTLELELFFNPDRWWIDLALGLASGGILILGWSFLRDQFASMRRVEFVIRETCGELDRSEIIAIALISGFSEELFFRGAMQMSWGWPWAVVIFGLLHIGPERSFRIWTLFALIAGGLFAGVTLWTGNILAAIVGHVLVNGVNMWRLMNSPPEDLGAEAPGGLW